MWDPALMVLLFATVAGGVLLVVVAWRSTSTDTSATAAAFWPDVAPDPVRRGASARLGVSHSLCLQGDGSGQGHRAVCECGWASPVMVTDGLAISAWTAHFEGQGMVA